MARQDTLRMLLAFLAPLGPNEEPEEREVREEGWVLQNPDLISDIFDLLLDRPPSTDLGRVTPEDFEYELSRVLTMIGEQDPVAFVEQLRPLLKQKMARPTVIEVLGALRSPKGLALLSPFVDDESLSEEESVRLACALGEIGGSDAREMLDRMMARTTCRGVAVLEEIRRAIAALGAY